MKRITAICIIGAVVIGSSGFAAYDEYKLYRQIQSAPSNSEALRLSISQLNLPGLKAAFDRHPQICSIEKLNRKEWTVACEGIPNHIHRTSDCRLSPNTCAIARLPDESCTSFYWNVDLEGNPFDPITNRSGNYASIQADCRY